mmetsp:Transcript_29833/g.84024  ORF Transcript_29833/g.84024 Transcript_29833/m.84024 type:complete len:236 (-) Transcript_29833:241-948(-)
MSGCSRFSGSRCQLAIWKSIAPRPRPRSRNCCRNDRGTEGSLPAACAAHAPTSAAYGISPSSARPFFITKSKASSIVAPLQPPCPPHSRGLGMQLRSCCAENVRCLGPGEWISECASSTFAAVIAQQEPQAPWFATVRAAVRFAQLTSMGRTRAGPPCRRERKDERRPPPWPPCCRGPAAPRRPRSTWSSWSVRSQWSFVPWSHRRPGSLLWASAPATRRSYRAFRSPYSAEPSL